ncbi:hypothetical protein ENUP19_0339G0003 [Entamoeba nuttalli]|uniref:Ras family protein n=2 Tax=Entamoeba nuttalli TaxID=412467 RepID=K2HI92_ENTNP|nr:Ras family protein [Entamoeba nuttalli P19]EKE42704.1 Ras family protein [Entamoeba nuttalli P19]|eukprot:XP_008854955.1 Ras family protein [Entamoeba nuttalli P19]
MQRSSFANSQIPQYSRKTSISRTSGLTIGSCKNLVLEEKYKYSLLPTSNYSHCVGYSTSPTRLNSPHVTLALPDSVPSSPHTTPALRERSGSATAKIFERREPFLSKKQNPPVTLSSMLQKELNSLVSITPNSRLTSYNIYLTSYIDQLIFSCYSLFDDPKVYLKPDIPYISSFSHERTSYFAVSTSIGIKQLIDVEFQNESYDVYIVITDLTEESASYLKSFSSKMIKFFGTQALKKLIVVSMNDNGVVNDFCTTNEVIKIVDEGELKNTIISTINKSKMSLLSSRLDVVKKVIILGDYFVGKSTLFKYLTQGSEEKNKFYEASVGITSKRSFIGDIDVFDMPGDFRMKAQINESNDDKTIEERAVDNTISYLHEKQIGGDLIIVMYDVTRITTVTYAQNLIKELKRVYPFASIIVLGNKLDLAYEYGIEPINCEFNNVNDMISLSLNPITKQVSEKLLNRIKFLLQSSTIDFSNFTKEFTKEGIVKVIEEYPKSSKGISKLVLLENARITIGMSKQKIGTKPFYFLMDQTTTFEEVEKKNRFGLVITSKHQNICMLFKEESQRKEWKASLTESLIVVKIGTLISKIVIQRFIHEALNEIGNEYDHDSDIERFISSVNSHLPSNNYSFPDPISSNINATISNNVVTSQVTSTSSPIDKMRSQTLKRSSRLSLLM